MEEELKRLQELIVETYIEAHISSPWNAIDALRNEISNNMAMDAIYIEHNGESINEQEH